MKQAVFVAYLCSLGLWLPLSQMEGTLPLIIGGISLGVFILSVFLFLFGLVSPFFISKGILVNNPKGKPIDPNAVHFFTFMEDGHSKIIVRGRKFVRAIMHDPQRVYLEKGDPLKNADHWWVRPAKPDEISEPIEPILWYSPLSWWIRYVYNSTGAVFVGIYPFQGVRSVKNQRVRQMKQDGKVIMDDQGRPKLEEVEDWSDHLRVKGSPWYFKILSCDTKDFLKLGFQGYLIVRCVNPYLATFNKERWDNVLNLKINMLVTAFCKSRTYEQLSTSVDQTRYELAEFLKKNLNESLCPPEEGIDEKLGIGMEILEANITDQDPLLNTEEQSALTAAWKAERQRDASIKHAEGTKQAKILESEGESQAIINRSEADAQAIVNRITAVKRDREIGELLAKYDAWKATAQAGGATYFFGDPRDKAGPETDKLVFAKLDEQLRQQKQNQPAESPKPAEPSKEELPKIKRFDGKKKGKRS